METLKPFFCAAALIGIHYTRSYLSETMYVTLIQAFPIIYDNLTRTPHLEEQLQSDTKVINFVTEAKFKSSLPVSRVTVNNCACQ